VSLAYRFLFLPVSAARGTGEYARALEIARAVAVRWPTADIRFMVSCQAPYAKSVPFPTELLDRSPTLQPREVADTIRALRPHVIVFDNAGRTSLLQVAREVGAKVVFVSSRPRQRAKAFRWRWMWRIDEHWIAYPVLLAGALGAVERLKLFIVRRPTIRFLDVLLPAEQPDRAATVPARYGLTAGEYVLVAPGGGAAHRSVPQAARIIGEAVTAIAAQVPEVLWLSAQPQTSQLPANVRTIQLLPMAELLSLIRFAKVVLTNGADTLLQVIALKRPCVAVSLAPDQTIRLRRLARHGVTLDVALEADVIATATVQLYQDADAARANVAKFRALSLTDGLGIATRAIENLLPRSGG